MSRSLLRVELKVVEHVFNMHKALEWRMLCVCVCVCVCVKERERERERERETETEGKKMKIQSWWSGSSGGAPA
jgi:hypothetical protein